MRINITAGECLNNILKSIYEEQFFIPFNEAMNEWCDYYDLDSEQISLIQKLFNARMDSNGEPIILRDDEIKPLYGDSDECFVSLEELNIFRAQ